MELHLKNGLIRRIIENQVKLVSSDILFSAKYFHPITYVTIYMSVDMIIFRVGIF